MEALDNSDLIDIILRQTQYNENEAKLKLQEYKNNVELVIRDFYGLNQTKKDEPLRTYNQEIYRQIRKKLQNVSTDVEIKKV
jgi:hypothetical protein